MDQLELSISNVLSILNLFFHYLEIYLSISLSLQHIIYFWLSEIDRWINQSHSVRPFQNLYNSSSWLSEIDGSEF